MYLLDHKTIPNMAWYAVGEEEIELSGIRELTFPYRPPQVIASWSTAFVGALPNFFFSQDLGGHMVQFVCWIWVQTLSIIFMTLMQLGGTCYSTRGFWCTFLWRKSVGIGGSFTVSVLPMASLHLFLSLWPVAHPSQRADELLVLTAAGWCELWVKVLVWNEHEKEQEISQAKELLDMAGLEGRVLFYACKLFLEGHLKCVSGYPRDLACCYLQLPFEDENVNTNIVIVPVIMLGMTITRGFFWVMEAFGKQNMDK